MPNKTKKPRASQEAAIPSAPQVAPKKSQLDLLSAPWMKHVYVALRFWSSRSPRIPIRSAQDSLSITFRSFSRMLAFTRQHQKILSQIVNRPAWSMPPEKGLYRPLTTFSYLFNYAMLENQEHPFGYHLVNFAIHFLNVLLCYGLALSVLRKFWPAVFIAALWAVHPVLTESITNIIGRADLLAAFGVLSGLWFYRMSREAQGARRIAWLFGLAIATTIGIFSKESAIVIVALIALWEFAFWNDRSNLRNLGYGIIAAGFANRSVPDSARNRPFALNSSRISVCR